MLEFCKSHSVSGIIRDEGLESWLTSLSNESQVPSKQRTRVRPPSLVGPVGGMVDIFGNEGRGEMSVGL